MEHLVYPFAATYGAVLAAELIGDRSVYSIGVLSTRFGSRAVVSGVIPAVALKAFAAVLFGDALRHLSRGVVATVSAVTFAVAAFLVWRRDNDGAAPNQPIVRATPSRGAATAFATIFFSEWADPGQLAAAAMASRYAPALVWVAATLALTTKAIVASSVGATLAQRVDWARWRVATAGLFLVMGVLALFRID